MLENARDQAEYYRQSKFYIDFLEKKGIYLVWMAQEPAAAKGELGGNEHSITAGLAFGGFEWAYNLFQL